MFSLPGFRRAGQLLSYTLSSMINFTGCPLGRRDHDRGVRPGTVRVGLLPIWMVSWRDWPVSSVDCPATIVNVEGDNWVPAGGHPRAYHRLP
jgi:hypothetical protein